MTRRDLHREMVNDALVQSQGDWKVAAQLLGCTRIQLMDWIDNCPDLAARWVGPYRKVKPPTTIETINRDLVNYLSAHRTKDSKVDDMSAKAEPPSLDQPLSSQDLALDKAMRSEDQKVKQGLPKMGMNAEELALANEMQECGAEYYRESLQIIGGGATRTSVIIQAQISLIKERLVDVRSKLSITTESNGSYTDDRQRWVREELGLMNGLVELGGLSKGMMEMGFKSALIRATIEKNGAERMKRAKPGKPGFVVDVGEDKPA